MLLVRSKSEGMVLVLNRRGARLYTLIYDEYV